jgi:hypothetical protein
MGILDDAIREHLDLKRRRGADPGEIDRLEREALGPVRRGPHEAFEPASGEPAVDDAPYAAGQPAEDWPQDESLLADHGVEFADDEEEADEWQVADRAPREHAIAPEPDAPTPAAPPPTPANPPAPARGSLVEDEYLEQETVEHDVEEELGSSEEDDMLEETPEFLQDTPDHDRLWFEQRPPRDFDLDG